MLGLCMAAVQPHKPTRMFPIFIGFTSFVHLGKISWKKFEKGRLFEKLKT